MSRVVETYEGIGCLSGPGRPIKVDNRRRLYCACSWCGCGLNGYFFLLTYDPYFVFASV